MPSRFGNPRGSIGRILKEAGEISDARLRSTMAYLDDFTSVEDNPQKQIGGGGRLTRGQYTAMLQQSPDFRQQLANRWLFATPTERDSLLVHLREAFPGQGRAALGVPGLDDTGIPDDQTGTGLGGPPQGGQALGAGLGPAPMAGAAPVPPMGPPPPLDMNAAGPPGPAFRRRRRRPWAVRPVHLLCQSRRSGHGACRWALRARPGCLAPATRPTWPCPHPAWGRRRCPRPR